MNRNVAVAFDAISVTLIAESFKKKKKDESDDGHCNYTKISPAIVLVEIRSSGKNINNGIGNVR